MGANSTGPEAPALVSLPSRGADRNANGERVVSERLQRWPAAHADLDIRCKPDIVEACLFLFLDVQAQNRSHLDDAITEISIELPLPPGVVSLPVHLPDGTPFFGESIPAHALRHLRVYLMLDRETYEKTVNWNPTEKVVWTLVAKTINDQAITEQIQPAGHFPAYVANAAVAELDHWRP